MTTGVLRCRVQDLGRDPTLRVLCAGYELEEWRAQDLVDDFFYRHLISFAFSYTDFEQIDGNTAALALKRAAEIVYDTDKYKSRGEFGELFLHGIAKDFWGAQPAVSKIYYKDSDNDTVKGFDSVHIVENDGAIEIWLGEVKFYKSLTSAITDVTAEILGHLQRKFLKREFVAITNKLDPSWPHTATVRGLLDRANSLDEISNHLVMPVLLTYDSKTLQNENRVDEAYIRGLEEEAAKAWEDFAAKLSVPLDITLHLVLMPLQDKARLLNLLHQKLRLWQHI